MNPRYIRVFSGRKAADGKYYRVLRLAEGNEPATMPIYGPVPRERATGPYTSEEAIQVIQRLVERDELNSGIRRGQAKHAGFVAEPETDE